MADFDPEHATSDNYGNVTAKNQDGIDAKARPLKSPTPDNWQFGDSLADVKPTKHK